MRTLIIKFIIIVALLSLIPLSNIPVVKSEGIGVVPAFIQMDNLLKGGTYIRQITIINTFTEPNRVFFSSRGDIEGWPTFYLDQNMSSPITNITVFTERKIMVEFTIPETIPSNEYNGSINVRALPMNVSSNQVTAGVTFSIVVLIGVTGNQILDGDAYDFKIQDAEVGFPLKISYKFLNTGNVMANPTTEIFISRQNWPINNITLPKKWIHVDCGEFLEKEIDTKNYESGEYKARIIVSLDDKMIADENISFTIHPRGTFSRKGKLSSLTRSGELQKESTIKINSTFINTGLIELETRFVLEVYKDSILFEVIESQDVIVQPSETHNFTCYYKISDMGDFDLVGCCHYDGRKTETITISFSIGFSNIDIALMVAVVIAVISLVVSFYIRKNMMHK